MDTLLMMDKQREILTNNINSLKETMDLITQRIQIIEDQLKIDDRIIKEVMKEDIDEVKKNTNEQPKKRGRKPKTIQEGGNEWAAELKSAEPDKKKEKPKHENKNYSYYKNSYTDEQRELCKERSRERYYKLKALKGEGVKKRVNNVKTEEVKRGRGRPRKNN